MSHSDNEPPVNNPPASSPCSMHEVDPAYMGLPTGKTPVSEPPGTLPQPSDAIQASRERASKRFFGRPRKTSAKILGGAALIVIAIVTALFASSCLGLPTADKPNVIYILADDAGINNFGAYGATMIKTPHIDGLARQGMRFTQHYAGSTVCAPSRSVLMTGKDTGSTRIRHNRKEASLLESDTTLAEVFKAAGYQTAIIGKWGLGQAGSPGAPNHQGFDYFFGFLDHANAHRYYPEFLWRNDRKVVFKDNQRLRQHYSQDLFTDEALQFIARAAEISQTLPNGDVSPTPFFLYLAYTAPHVDLDVPEASMAPYLGKLGSDKPSMLPWAQLWGYRQHPTPKAALAGMLSRMDNDIGKILAKLDALGLSENTLVMFASDNGPSAEGGAPIEFFDSNGVFRGGKRDFYEGGIRVPLIARWPAQIPAGVRSDHLSGFVDMFATFAELVEVPLDTHDGISFLPTLLGEKDQQKHSYLYWEIQSKLPLNTEKQAIRYGHWKLLRLRPWALFSRYELYNLKTDPQERNNLAKLHPARVAQLAALMDSHHTPDSNYPLGHYDE